MGMTNQVEGPTTPSAGGVATDNSPLGFDETVDRLLGAIAARGLQVFDVIDHQAALLALDLPLRILVWEGHDGRVGMSHLTADSVVARTTSMRQRPARLACRRRSSPACLPPPDHPRGSFRLTPPGSTTNRSIGSLRKWPTRSRKPAAGSADDCSSRRRPSSSPAAAHGASASRRWRNERAPRTPRCCTTSGRRRRFSREFWRAGTSGSCLGSGRSWTPAVSRPSAG